ncbi:MAG: hypothetical protein OXG60_13855 [Chloroflexi bacterium]|nr:hypothetical protein [Chloroflexota bacterium]
MFSTLVIWDIAASIERQHQPQLCGSPLILMTGNQHLKVLATDALARQAGVQIGDTRKQAELHCPDAAILPAREDVYRRLFTEVIADLFHYVDKMEPRYSSGNAVLVVNTQHADELDFLRARIQSHLGGKISMGTASSKFVARVAGTSGAGHCVVAEGEEAAFLAPFPATSLPLNKDMHRRIPMMGIRTIGDYVALSRTAVFEQWGKHGLWCYDLAIGLDSRPLQSCQLAPVLTQSLSFDDSVADKEILISACLQLARVLIQQLNKCEAGRLILLLTDENYMTHEIHLAPNIPIRSLSHLQRQLPLLLEKPAYTTGIFHLKLQLCELTPVQPRQLSLFNMTQHQYSLNQAIRQWQKRFDEKVSQPTLTDAPRYFPPELQYEMVSA